ncbi:MAG: hypothetical protein U0R80_15570 [Nocardioidaceae bacterium]
MMSVPSRAARGAGWLVALVVASAAPMAPMPAASSSTQEAGSTVRGREVFRFEDGRIDESSGLVFQRGVFITVNDSGNPALLFSVDPLSGGTVQTTAFADSQVDVEALAPAGGDEVWVADIGDNGGARHVVTVTRVAVDGAQVPTGTTYELAYPDKLRLNAETLMADPDDGRLYVVTKSVLGGTVYAAPESLDPDRPNRLKKIGRVGGIITDGAFFPDGRDIVVRDYGRAAIYTFPGLRLVGEFALPKQRQGEGITVSADGALYLSSEGPQQAVLQVKVPPALQLAMDAAPTPSPTPSPSDEPGSGAGDGSADGSSGSLSERTVALVAGGSAAALVVAVGLVVLLRRRQRD